jgi:hypothetical protein
MPFNTETLYMLWDAEHTGETIAYVREDAESYYFDEDGTELVLSKTNVVDLGDSHPPANKESEKHYISLYDGSVSYGASLPSSPEYSQSLPSSQNSGQSGGKRKSGKSHKSRKSGKSRKNRKNRKTKKLKSKSRK